VLAALAPGPYLGVEGPGVVLEVERLRAITPALAVAGFPLAALCRVDAQWPSLSIWPVVWRGYHGTPGRKPVCSACGRKGTTDS
jgi:hypothetical protein